MIKRGVMCFVGGSLRLVDLDKDGRPVNGSVAAETAQKDVGGNALDVADKNAGPTRDEIREELRKRGIPFKATMSKADLSALLVSGRESVADQSGESVATGTDTAGATTGEATPDTGTGNQEVL